MFQLRVCVNGLLDTIDSIFGSCAVVNEKGHIYRKEHCNLSSQENYREIRGDVSALMGNESPEYVKQRSPEWFSLRETVKVTGSVAHESTGLDTLKAQKDFL